MLPPEAGDDRETGKRGGSVDVQNLLQLAQEALKLSVLVSLPVVGAVALVGLLVSLLQAAMQLQEQSLGQLARLVATLAVLTVAGSWMGNEILRFTVKAFSGS
jgi:type III secretion HrpO family protein